MKHGLKFSEFLQCTNPHESTVSNPGAIDIMINVFEVGLKHFAKNELS